MLQYDKINLNINEILQSVSPKHVTEYDWLVQNLHCVAEADYQRRYKSYWRLNGAGLSQQFCQEYFQRLQEAINNMPKLGILVNQLYEIPIRQNRHALQFSFCTKLCHMLDGHLPIYDSNIRNFYNFKPPMSNLPVQNRIAQFLDFHQHLVSEYSQVLLNKLLSESIQAFRQCFHPQHFTDIKIIDSLIWASSPRKKKKKTISKIW